jgi:hypothetical protein
MLARADISFLALQVGRPPVHFPGVLQHINSARKSLNLINAFSQRIFTLSQVLHSSTMRT